MSLRRLLFLLGFCLLACTSAFAQTEAATLSGLITDPQGRPVPGVEVTVTNQDTNVSVQRTTNDAGLYVAVGLKPGRYRVSIAKDGFRRIDLTELVLNVQDVLSRNFQLQLGPVTTSITVVADEATINTTDATVSTVIDRQFAANLPLNGRSFQSLITLTPGVVLASPSNTAGGQFSVNGQRTSANYFTVDGVSANIGITPANNSSNTGIVGAGQGFTALGGTNNLVSVDALQEFRIQTSNFAPEFGRTPGAQVSIVTRSGTNEFHGNVFEYFRNDVLDANDWFANRAGSKKPPLRQNDFGGVFGGPIFRDKTYFFFSYEGLRLRQPQFAIADVPDLATRQTAPPGLVPILNSFSLPNGPATVPGLAELSASYSDPSSLDATGIRLDHALTPKLALFGRYSYATSETGTRSRTSLSNQRVTHITTNTVTIGASWAFRSTSVNEFRFNYSRNEAGSVSVMDSFGGAVPVSDSDIFPAFASRQDSNYFLLLAFGAFPGTGVGRIAQNTQRQINVIDSISIARGTHAIKFGVDYRRLHPTLSPFQYGQFIEFDDISTLLTGTADFVQLLSARGGNLLYHNLSAYAQDTWRIQPRLTVTYGVRWDVNPALSSNSQPQAVSVQGINDPSTLQLAPLGAELYATSFGNFAPRVGLAYQVVTRPGAELVLRGGFGTFFDLGASQSSAIFGGYPFVAEALSFGVPYPLSAADAAAPPLQDPANPVFPIADPVFGFDPNFQLPRTYQWTFALDQAIGANQRFTASYVASIGRRLLRTRALVRPNPNFISSVLIMDNEATSDYEALQVQFQRRLAHGLQALASYTWSHAIDDVSTDLFDSGQTRASSDFDQRHAYSVAITYDIPAPRRRFFNKVLGNWGIDTIVRGRSALPVNLIARQNVNLNGLTTNVRPDVVVTLPTVLEDPTAPGGWRFNPLAFVQPPFGPPPARLPLRQGTLGRNALRGFPLHQTDLSLRRQFQLTERARLTFRADLFNIFNHPNFASPNARVFNSATVRNPNFGVSELMYGASLFSGGALAGGFNPLYQIGGSRSVQLALKFEF